jgi:hypothetical protein
LFFLEVYINELNIIFIFFIIVYIVLKWDGDFIPNKINKDDNIMSGDQDLMNNILKNIKLAKDLPKKNKSLQIVIVVSGSDTDRKEWEERFEKTGSLIFNSKGSTKIISLQEKIGTKTREGNFLGTLLAYRNLKEIAEKKEIAYRSVVPLLGMLFGRGERISPFTQIEGDRKPAIRVSAFPGSSEDGPLHMTALEEALLYFSPVALYLEQRGFRGILDKWGDETEIASIDLSANASDENEFADIDVLKFVSRVDITEELALQKDWVIFDSRNNVFTILSRNDKKNIERKIESFKDNIHFKERPETGISLGPVAVSYKFLDIALEVFKNDIEKNNVFLDFDPYFLMGVAFEGNKSEWQESLSDDKNYNSIISMIPDFYEKIFCVKNTFEKMYGRKLNFKIFDMGESVYWADIGQHNTMFEKYMLLRKNTREGIIGRIIEDLPEKADVNGNIIVHSYVSPKVSVKNSVIVNTFLGGEGFVTDSVIKDSVINAPSITGAFAVLSYRPLGETSLEAKSGIYRSIGLKPLSLESNMRQGTLLLNDKQIDLVVRDDTNLRDKETTYNVPILGNPLSFHDAYNLMYGVSMSDLDARREQYKNTLEERIKSDE